VSECDSGISAMRNLRPPRAVELWEIKLSPSPSTGIWNVVSYNYPPYSKNRKFYSANLYFTKIHVSRKRICVCMQYAIVCCLRMARICRAAHLTCVVEIWTHLIVRGSRVCWKSHDVTVIVAWLFRVYVLQMFCVEVTICF